MKKIVFIVTLAFTFTGKTRAQFMQSVGGSVSVMYTHLNSDYYSTNVVFAFKDLTYFPRYNLVQSDNASLSVGVPLGIGFGSATNVGNGDDGRSSLYFGFDAPLVVDYNIGCKSTADNGSNFGGYIGGGFGYRYSSFSIPDYYGESSFQGKSYGPLVRAGIRFGIPPSALGITIGLYYKVGLEAEKYKTAGMNILIDL